MAQYTIKSCVLFKICCDTSVSLCDLPCIRDILITCLHNVSFALCNHWVLICASGLALISMHHAECQLSLATATTFCVVRAVTFFSSHDIFW